MMGVKQTMTLPTTAFSWSALLLACACLSPVLVASQGIDLGGGIVTSTDVQAFADLPQDLTEMENYVKQGQPEEGLGLYRDGLHSEVREGVKRSFKSLADTMAAAEVKTPSYLFHLYGQADRELNLAFDQQKLNYINTNVEDFFETAPTFAVQGVMVLNLWMYATHLLYNGVFECEQRSRAEEAAVFDVKTAGWDEFIALYIGSGQTPGATNGDSLYKWAQFYSNQLFTNQGEAQVNTRIKLLYQEASSIMNVQNACTKSNPNTPEKLWPLVIQVVSEMSKPLFQGFVVALLDKNVDLVNIYAKALVPQLAKCRPSLYKRMHEALILNRYDGDATVTEGILSDISDAAKCFGFLCGELGDKRVGAVDSCSSTELSPSDLSFAGYAPETLVSSVGQADLDVYQIKVLANLNSKEFAYYLYMYGANIPKFRQGNDPLEYVSLHDIAISSERSSAQPWFNYFVDYNGEKDYADKTIQSALLGTSEFKATQQVSAIVSITAAYQILFLEAVTKLKIAVEECREADPEEGTNFVLNPIDETAALLIGSMEGSQLGGSSDLEDGQLIYNVNNKHAFQFGTINQFQYSKSVSSIEDLLYAAKAQLDGLDCDSLERSADEILRFSTVGITQASIFLAVKNEGLGEFSTSAGLAEAEGFALSILPLIHQTDPDTAAILDKNSVRLNGQEPVPSGGEAVGKLWGKGFTYAMQLDCSNLGSIQAVDPCDGEWGQAEFSHSSAVPVSTRLSMLLATGVAAWVFLTI